MTQGLINKLVSVLEATLGKLSRYDEGSFIGSFLKITVSWKTIIIIRMVAKSWQSWQCFYAFLKSSRLQNVSGSGKELGQGYVNFLRNNIDLMRSKINDDLWILNFFEQWYSKQITIICTWLSERLDHSLHVFQCLCLSHIVKVMTAEFWIIPPVNMWPLPLITILIRRQIKFSTNLFFKSVFILLFRKSTEILSFKESWRTN